MKTVLIVLLGSWMAGIAIQAVRFAVYRKRVHVINRSAGWKTHEERTGLRRNSGAIVLWWLLQKKKTGLALRALNRSFFVNRLYFYLEGKKDGIVRPGSWQDVSFFLESMVCVLCRRTSMLCSVLTGRYARCQVERGKVVDCASGYPATGMKLVEEKK